MRPQQPERLGEMRIRLTIPQQSFDLLAPCAHPAGLGEPARGRTGRQAAPATRGWRARQGRRAGEGRPRRSRVAQRCDARSRRVGNGSERAEQRGRCAPPRSAPRLSASLGLACLRPRLAPSPRLAPPARLGLRPPALRLLNCHGAGAAALGLRA